MENWKNGQLIGTEPDPEPEEQHPVPPTIEEQILALQNALITSKISGGGITTVTDSSDNQIKDFKLFGKSEQVTTTGKNLFDISKLSSNMAVEITEDKLVLPQGGAIYFNSLKETSPELKIGDEVFLFGDTTSSLKQVGFHHPTISLPMWTFGNKITITKEILESSLLFYSDVSKRTVLQNIMITKENSKTYEPYTGGQPSPSPEYPQEIKSVGKWNEEKQKYDVDVKITGKNLFDIVFARNKDNYKPISGKPYELTGIEYDLVPNTDYVLSISGKISNPKSNLFIANDSGRKSLAINNVFHHSVNSLDSGKIYVGFSGISLNNGIPDFESEYFDIQLEVGNARTKYEPYREPQIVTLSLDEPLRETGKSKDVLTKDGIVRNVKRETLETGRKFLDFSPSTNNCRIAFDPKFNVKSDIDLNVKNTHFTKHSVIKYLPSLYLIFTNYELQQIGIDLNGTKKDAEVKLNEFISKNTIEYVYPIREPITEPLPEDFKQALEKLSTYYPTTVITVDGGEVDPDIEVSYITDTKNYIDQKIAAIGKTVVETQKALL